MALFVIRWLVVLGISATAQGLFTESAPWRTWCLADQGCGPTATCKEQAGGGDWHVCMDDLDLNDCLVYSVGIADDWSFDSAMGKLGCEVHSFDPTVDLPENLAPNVTFHQIGLNAGGIQQDEMQETYGTFKGPLLTLNEVLAMLGHVHRRISVFKIDCEGCEWEVFKSLQAMNSSQNGPDQLLVEIHLSEQLGVHSEADIAKMGAAFEYLYTPDANCQTFSQFHWHDNAGFEQHRTIPEPLLAAGLPAGVCCRELGFIKTKSTALQRRHHHHKHCQD